LALDEKLLGLIPARPPDYPEHEDLFPGKTGQPFDSLAAAETAANLTLSLILNPERLARIIEYHARMNDAPNLEEIMDILISKTWKTSFNDAYYAEIQRVVNNVALYKMIEIAKNENAASSVRSMVYFKLEELKEWLLQDLKLQDDANLKAHHLYTASQIKLFQENPDKVSLTPPLVPPKGAPI
jgi:hypothetical protein